MWNKTRALAKMSQAALANIRQYTPPDEYELIVVEDEKTMDIWDPYKVLNIDTDPNTKHIVNEENIGYAADMNMGAKAATGEYLCFIENDNFVWEGWLKGLRHYLDNDICDVIAPWQIPISYTDWQKYKKADWTAPEVFFERGWQEQGILMMTREIFDKSGGWDERFKKVFTWKAYKPRLIKAGARIANTAKVHFTHVTGTTYWSNMEFDLEGFRKQEAIEGGIIHDEF